MIVHALLKEWAERYRLSAAEAVTLRLAVDGMRRHEIAARRGVEASTVRSQIRTLLGKVGAATIAEMIGFFYRELYERTLRELDAIKTEVGNVEELAELGQEAAE